MRLHQFGAGVIPHLIASRRAAAFGIRSSARRGQRDGVGG